MSSLDSFVILSKEATNSDSLNSFDMMEDLVASHQRRSQSKTRRSAPLHARRRTPTPLSTSPPEKAAPPSAHTQSHVPRHGATSPSRIAASDGHTRETRAFEAPPVAPPPSPEEPLGTSPTSSPSSAGGSGPPSSASRCPVEPPTLIAHAIPSGPPSQPARRFFALDLSESGTDSDARDHSLLARGVQPPGTLWRSAVESQSTHGPTIALRTALEQTPLEMRGGVAGDPQHRGRGAAVAPPSLSPSPSPPCAREGTEGCASTFVSGAPRCGGAPLILRRPPRLSWLQSLSFAVVLLIPVNAIALDVLAYQYIERLLSPSGGANLRRKGTRHSITWLGTMVLWLLIPNGLAFRLWVWLDLSVAVGSLRCAWEDLPVIEEFVQHWCADLGCTAQRWGEVSRSFQWSPPLPRCALLQARVR